MWGSWTVRVQDMEQMWFNPCVRRKQNELLFTATDSNSILCISRLQFFVLCKAILDHSGRGGWSLHRRPNAEFSIDVIAHDIVKPLTNVSAGVRVSRGIDVASSVVWRTRRGHDASPGSQGEEVLQGSDATWSVVLRWLVVVMRRRMEIEMQALPRQSEPESRLHGRRSHCQSHSSLHGNNRTSAFDRYNTIPATTELLLDDESGGCT